MSRSRGIEAARASWALQGLPVKARIALRNGWSGMSRRQAQPERIRPPRQYLCVDEEQPVGRQAAGRQAATAIVAPEDFEDAFREHFAPVYRFIARRVGTALAEDLAAEAFATAYRRRASYEPSRGSLRSWLYGIAANVVRSHWRDEQQLLELDARLAPASRRPVPGRSPTRPMSG